MTKSILEEAQEIIYGDREEAYGKPSINLERIAALWDAYDRARLIGCTYPGKVDERPEDVAMKMVLLKIARQLHNPKRDNLVDACGYIALIERMLDGD